MRIPRSDGLLRAAINGVEVWFWYALVEYVFCTVVPILIHRDRVLDVVHWRGTVILFLCYAAAGMVLGLLAGLSLDAARMLATAEFERRSRKLLILTIPAAFAIHLASLAAGYGQAAALGVVLLVNAAVISNAGQKGSTPGFSGSPAAVATTLVIGTRLAFATWPGQPQPVTVPLTMLAAVVGLVLAILAIRLASLARASLYRKPIARHGLVAATVVALVFGPAAISHRNAAAGPPDAITFSRSTPLPLTDASNAWLLRERIREALYGEL